jgi:hypothetical protein
MCRFFLVIASLMILSGCDPISVTIKATQLAFMAKAEEDLKQQEAYQKYEEPCLWPRFNAPVLAREMEKEQQWLQAAHYYYIARQKGHGPSVSGFERSYAQLSDDEREQLSRMIGRHTPENFEKCYRVIEGRY